MDLRQLRYFVAVARSGSFSKGASEVHIAQPALSSQIAALESELGAQLLVRHSRGVDLTHAGERLLTGAEDILHRVDALRGEIHDLGKGFHGHVRLGVPTTTTQLVAIPLLERIRQCMPGLQLQVVEAMTGHLERWLEHDDLDAAILFASAKTEKLRFREIGSERLALIGPRIPELAGFDEVSFSQIIPLPLVHTSPDHTLRRLIDTYCRQLKAPANLVAEIDSLAQIKTLVFNGKGFTILPQMAVTPDWVSGPINAWPITDEGFGIKLVIVPSARFERMPYCEATLDLVQSVSRDLIRAGLWRGAELDEASGINERLPMAVGRV
jgi:LysR family transcriptional regulator, nitrogen assimilation regulatory protein